LGGERDTMAKAPPGQGEVGGGRSRGKPSGLGETGKRLGRGSEPRRCWRGNIGIDPPWSPLLGGKAGADPVKAAIEGSRNR
jgi:hypothetical protein